jgi:hypothetical protein
MNTEYTAQDIANIVREAEQAAYYAADRFFQEKLGGKDRYACGFAWVNVYSLNGEKIRANSKVGKALIAAGVRKNSYEKAFQIWNPSKYGCQNIDTLEAGASAAAEVFTKYGFTAYAGSRLD